MFVKQIKKKNKNSDKQYVYYRLVHTYKIGNKVRHQNILSLGGLETLPRERHKALADRIEELVTGNSTSLFPDKEHFEDVEALAVHFAEKIIKEKLFGSAPDKQKKISKEIGSNFQEVDLETTEQIDSKEIGGEWFVKQVFDKLGIASILEGCGFDNPQVDIAQILLTGKLLHPSSELEAERWLKENSGARELYLTKEDISRYRLYGAAGAMYQNKDFIEKELYNKLNAKTGWVTDNRGNKIELTKATVEGKEDNFLHIKSNQKLKKEESIDHKLTQRLESQLQDIKNKLPKKGTLKKTEKVHEKVGGIKAKLSKIGWLYTIKYTEDKGKGIVTDINWHRAREREKPKGEYFLRYTNDTITETDVWDVYNMTRDVEAVFRCLKTDLKIRPIHHQKDKYIEPHLWLGILAYQIVNYTRRRLKENNIDYSWSTIVEKMRPMQSSIVSVNNKENKKLYIKLCTRPTKDQKQIFDSHDFKHRPYVRKIKVVPQL